MEAAWWDPDTYLEYAGERGRPFADLIARVGAGEPRAVVDLGCGPGNLTALLPKRWPAARVVGVDSSPEMIAVADRTSGVEFMVCDLRDWRPATPVDVLLSNAALQWVPGHLDLLPALVRNVAPGGWFALQVPGNFDQPSHTVRRDLAEDPRFAPHLLGVATPAAFGADVYLEALSGLGCSVDAWETTYLHVLTGEDPVLGWVRSTVLRPVLAELTDGEAADLTTAYAALLRAAYPARPDGTTVLPFRRVFAVGRRPA